jgi:hypothetical protein
MSEPITNVADAVRVLGALPVPVGPEPQALSADRLNEIAARTDAATAGPWCTDSWEIYQGTEYEPGFSLWIGETCRGTTSPEQDCADAAFVAAARSDVPDLLVEVARLTAQVAALLAERHSTNESLSLAAEQLRVDRDRIAELEASRQQWRQTAHLLAGASGLIPQSSSVEVSADKLRQLLAPRDPDACTECGDGPSVWCPGCAKCSCVAEHDVGCARRAVDA